MRQMIAKEIEFITQKQKHQGRIEDAIESIKTMRSFMKEEKKCTADIDADVDEPADSNEKKSQIVKTRSIKLIKRRAVLEKFGFSRTHLYLKTKPGSSYYDETFPRGKRLSVDPSSKAPLFWLESELDVWALNRIGKADVV